MSDFDPTLWFALPDIRFLKSSEYEKQRTEITRIKGLNFLRSLTPSDTNRMALRLVDASLPGELAYGEWYLTDAPTEESRRYEDYFREIDLAEKRAIRDQQMADREKSITSMEHVELARFIREYPEHKAAMAEAVARILTGVRDNG